MQLMLPIRQTKGKMEDNFENKKIQQLINNLESEKQNVNSPFLPLQLEDIIALLNLIKNKQIDKYTENILNEIGKIKYWATDTWHFDNKIAIELIEVVESYEKLLIKKMSK